MGAALCYAAAAASIPPFFFFPPFLSVSFVRSFTLLLLLWMRAFLSLFPQAEEQRPCDADADAAAAAAAAEQDH